MIERLSSADYALALIVVTGGIAFGTQVFEHGLGMAPCPLCLMQRLWIFLAAIVAAISVAHNPRWGIYPLLTILASLAGAAFAIRHLWLPILPPGQSPSCSAPLAMLFEQGFWGEAWSAMFFGTGDCTAADAVLGLSLPVWALLGFAAIIALAVLQWRARR